MLEIEASIAMARPCVWILVGLVCIAQIASSLGSGLHDSRPTLVHSFNQHEAQPPLNNRPIIGVLAQEVPKLSQHYGDTYFMASYVSFMEMAGARVVPVRVGENMDYYTSLFNKINGVVFPGGGVDLLTSKYSKAAQIIFNLARKANDAGDRFPLLGICLGHELFTVLVAGKSLVEDCDAEKLILPINLSPEAKHSRMFGSAPRDVIDIITSDHVTANLHNKCISPKNFTKSSLHKFFRILSTNKDRGGKVFVSSMEAKKYPFYGLQFHPEKNMFIWDLSIPLNHSQGAVRIGQYLADFFVGEARRSEHHYPDVKSEGAALIQNYQPVYMGPPKFQLNYYFNLTSANSTRGNKPESTALRFKPMSQHL